MCFNVSFNYTADAIVFFTRKTTFNVNIVGDELKLLE